MKQTEIRLSELAEHVGGDLKGDGAHLISGPRNISEAEAGHITFLSGERYQPLIADTRAGCVVVHREYEVEREDLNVLRVDDPNRAFSEIVQLFLPGDAAPEAGVHPAAVVHADAQLGDDVSVGPGAVVGAGARVGDRSQVRAMVCIGRDAVVGSDCVLHPRVVLYPGVALGDRVLIHAGAVVGSDGFGFDREPDGSWTKVPQVGSVEIGDDVEIGANATIDRARFGTTLLSRGTKVDNLVQVGHNVQVGEDCLLIAQVGVSGSSVIEKGVILAGQCGIGGHVRVGEGARIGGQSGVTKDVAPGRRMFGTPAVDVRERNRLRPSWLANRLEALERRIRTVEGDGDE